MSTSSALSGADVLSLLTALPLPSSAALELISVHAPFTVSSALPTGALNKWLGRLNAVVTARETLACSIAELVIRQDTEGYVAAQCGKAWMNACLGSLGGTTLSIDAIPAFLGLTRALFAAGSHAPTFEREVVHPATGKLAVTVGRLVERVLEAGDWNVMSVVLETTRAFIAASPAPFRPAIPTIRPSLMSLVLRVPPNDNAPEQIRTSAAETLALLHLCVGKAAAPAAWGSEMKESLGGIAASITALAAEAWEEEPPRAAPLPPPASLPAFTADSVVRVSSAIQAIEGYTEIILSLLRLSTARPVPVPLAQIVSTGLRLLNLTLDTPMAAHISPQHQAALVSSFPRLWRSGLLLLAAAATTCGDHLVPHLSAILEFSVYLLERVPPTMIESRLNLLRFHGLLLEMFPAPILPVEYTTRLLRFSAGIIGTLLDSRPPPNAAAPAGRRSKKRARGAEDALVGGLEGRAPRGATKEDVDIVIAALQLTPLLHTAPLLSPALLTFSIRLHLSAHLALRSRPTIASYAELTAAIDNALEAAAHLEAGGTARDVRTLLVALLPATSSRNAALNELLHPALPPQARPMPPLSQLHMFAPETEEEKRLRREMGFQLPGEEAIAHDDDEDDDEAMVVDEVPQSTPAVATATSAPVAIPVVAFAPKPVSVVSLTPAPFSQPVPQPAPQASQEPETAAVPPSATMDPSVPFMSTPSARPATTTVVEVEVAAAPAPAEDGSEDEAIPELDSGSEDDEDDEDM